MKKLIALFFVLLLSINTMAQDDEGGVEVIDDFLSPFTTDANKVMITGILTTGLALSLLEDKIYGEYHDHIVDKQLMDENTNRYFDYFGQGIPNAIYIGYWYWQHKKSESNVAKWRYTHMLKSTLHAVAMTTMLKHTIRQKRPDPSENKDSFPSGHTTSAFAFASVVAKNHSLPWGITAYTLATLGGYQRINDNRHYIHDVMTGATIGISYGLSIAYRNKAKAGKDSAAYMVVPTEDYNGAQFAMLKSF